MSDESDMPNPRSRVLIIGGNKTGFAAAVARRLAAAGNMTVVIPEGTRIDPPDPADRPVGLRSLRDWLDFDVPEQPPEDPRDRSAHISGLQLGRKHNKKKGKR